MKGDVIAVTGATGFIGGQVAQALGNSGYLVVGLGRRPVLSYEYRHYDLGGPVTPGLLDGVDAIIHCAYDLSLTSSQAIATINVQGTKQLAVAASAAGVRMILVSSMSAYSGTRQIYGQAKLVSEADVRSIGGEAVRLGLVWGGVEGGMIGTLKRLARLPVVPRFGRNLYQFTTYIDDVSAGIIKLLESPPVGEPLGLAHPEKVAFESILEALAEGRRVRFVTVPWHSAFTAMRAAERVGIPLPVRADSLLGLVRPAPSVPNVERWEHLGLRLSPFLGSASEPVAPATREET